MSGYYTVAPPPLIYQQMFSSKNRIAVEVPLNSVTNCETKVTIKFFNAKNKSVQTHGVEWTFII